jgi:hypothetical protein
MYSTRFNGCSKDNDIHDQMDTTLSGPMTPLISESSPLSKLGSLTTLGSKRGRTLRRRGPPAGVG